MRCAALALAFFFTALPACSSDALPEPEPELEQPGAFVAVERGAGGLALFRTLAVLHVENGDTILFVTVYDVEPSSFEEARELSKDHDLRIRELVTSASRNVLILSRHEVVWFRTLTEEEEGRL